MAKLDWSRVKTPLGSTDTLRPVTRPTSKAQWRYLDILAGELGYPNGRRLVADLTNQDPAALLNVGSFVASSCIKQARARLTHQGVLGKDGKIKSRSGVDLNRRRG